MAIIKDGKYYYYDFTFEGKRYRSSCKTTDRKLAEQKRELDTALRYMEDYKRILKNE